MIMPCILQTKLSVIPLEHIPRSLSCPRCALESKKYVAYSIVKIDLEEGFSTYKCPQCGAVAWIEYCGTKMKGKYGRRKS